MCLCWGTLDVSLQENFQSLWCWPILPPWPIYVILEITYIQNKEKGIEESNYLSLEWDARLIRWRYILKSDSSDVAAEAGPPVTFQNHP